MRQCLSFDGNEPDQGRILRPQCERRMADALRGIAVNTPVLLLVATKRASVNMGHGVRSQADTAPSMLRDGAWELYCRTEREIRLAAIAAGCAQGSHAGRSVPGLCQAILKRIDRLLLLVNAAGWLDDLTDLDHRIRLTLNPPRPKWRWARARTAPAWSGAKQATTTASAPTAKPAWTGARSRTGCSPGSAPTTGG